MLLLLLQHDVASVIHGACVKRPLLLLAREHSNMWEEAFDERASCGGFGGRQHVLDDNT